MAKKRLYEIIKEMSLDEMAEYMCRLTCPDEECDCDCKEYCKRPYERHRNILEQEWAQGGDIPAAEPKAEPESDSYKSAGATMASYIFEGKVNFCFKRPGAQDMVYSVKIDGPEDTPPIREALEAIRKKNCYLCGREYECDNAHKAMCKVTIMRYKKLYKK